MTAHQPQHEAARNPEEQMSIVRDIGRELGEIFVQYIQGQIDFAEVSFAAYDALQDVHVVATGEYELLAGDDDDDEAEAEDDVGYDEEAHLREQEELSGEPSR